MVDFGGGFTNQIYGDFHGDFHGVWTDGFDRKDPGFHGGIPW